MVRHFPRTHTYDLNHGTNFPPLVSTGVPITGPWNVSFDPKWGGPKEVLFASLDDWSKRAEPGIKYYSGTAVYRTAFNVPDGIVSGGKRYYLDLGAVKNLARVRINGHDLGVTWCYPWRVDATSAVKTGQNNLEIEVVNLWPNRLIGDSLLPPQERLTSTTYDPYRKDSPLLPSGLLGPVTLLEHARD